MVDVRGPRQLVPSSMRLMKGWEQIWGSPSRSKTPRQYQASKWAGRVGATKPLLPHTQEAPAASFGEVGDCGNHRRASIDQHQHQLPAPSSPRSVPPFPGGGASTHHWRPIGGRARSFVAFAAPEREAPCFPLVHSLVSPVIHFARPLDPCCKKQIPCGQLLLQCS